MFRPLFPKADSRKRVGFWFLKTFYIFVVEKEVFHALCKWYIITKN